MIEGRSIEQKRELAQVFTREMARICNCNEAGIFVVIEDVKAENWSVGGTLVSDRTSSK